MIALNSLSLPDVQPTPARIAAARAMLAQRIARTRGQRIRYWKDKKRAAPIVLGFEWRARCVRLIVEQSPRLAPLFAALSTKGGAA